MTHTITLPDAAQEAARLETLRLEAFTADLQVLGFHPDIIALLILFKYERIALTVRDQARMRDLHAFRVRNRIIPIIITLAADATTFDFHEAIVQAGFDSLRDLLGPGWRALNTWFAKGSFVSNLTNDEMPPQQDATN